MKVKAKFCTWHWFQRVGPGLRALDFHAVPCRSGVNLRPTLSRPQTLAGCGLTGFSAAPDYVTGKKTICTQMWELCLPAKPSERPTWIRGLSVTASVVRSPGEGADSRAGCTRGRADVLFSQNPFGSVPRTGAHGREQGFGHEARPSVGEEGSLRWLREQLQDELKHRPEDPPGESPAGIDPVTFGHAAASFALRGAGSPPEPCSSTAAGRRRAPAPPSPELRSTSTWMFPEDFRHLGALRLPESPPPRRRQPAAEAGRAHDGERSVEQLDRWLMEWVGAHSQGWRDHQAGASPERDRARLHAGRSLRVAT